jgi:hypothetical protein
VKTTPRSRTENWRFGSAALAHRLPDEHRQERDAGNGEDNRRDRLVPLELGIRLAGDVEVERLGRVAHRIVILCARRHHRVDVIEILHQLATGRVGGQRHHRVPHLLDDLRMLVDERLRRGEVVAGNRSREEDRPDLPLERAVAELCPGAALTGRVVRVGGPRGDRSVDHRQDHRVVTAGERLLGEVRLRIDSRLDERGLWKEIARGRRRIDPRDRLPLEVVERAVIAVGVDDDRAVVVRATATLGLQQHARVGLTLGKDVAERRKEREVDVAAAQREHKAGIILRDEHLDRHADPLLDQVGEDAGVALNICGPLRRIKSYDDLLLGGRPRRVLARREKHRYAQQKRKKQTRKHWRSALSGPARYSRSILKIPSSGNRRLTSSVVGAWRAQARHRTMAAMAPPKPVFGYSGEYPQTNRGLRSRSC